MQTLKLATSGCALLLVGCAFCWGQEAVKPVETTLCDLYEHPEQYAGKMIKVRGGSVSGLRIEDVLHDSRAVPCSAYMDIVVVFPEQVEPAPGFQLIRDESYKKLAEALRSRYPIRIDATYEGRFDAAFTWRDRKRLRVGQGQAGDYAEKLECDGRIVLRQVSGVWTMRIPRR